MKLSSFSETFVEKYKRWLKSASNEELTTERKKLEFRKEQLFEQHWKDADVEALEYVLEEIDFRKVKTR